MKRLLKGLFGICVIIIMLVLFLGRGSENTSSSKRDAASPAITKGVESETETTAGPAEIEIADPVETQENVEPDPTELTAEESPAAEEPVQAEGGVNPELKAFLDEYEAFMDEYIAFMKNYAESDDTAGMLLDYGNMMKEYADFMAAVGAYNTEEFSTADAAYYLEVVNRVNQKLLETAY